MGTLTAAGYEAAVRAVMDGRGFAEHSEAARTLVDASRRLDVPAKTYLRRPGEAERLGLVIRGLVRVLRVTQEGREFTLCWAGPGALVSTLELIDPGNFDLYLQAVTPTVWCDFDVRVVRHLLRTDTRAGWLALRIAEARTRYLIEHLTVFAYGDVRTRVKWVLLDAACKRPDHTLFAELTQEELATGVAAARQSVAKVLGELRRAGAIQTTRRGISILRPEALTPKGVPAAA